MDERGASKIGKHIAAQAARGLSQETVSHVEWVCRMSLRDVGSDSGVSLLGSDQPLAYWLADHYLFVATAEVVDENGAQKGLARVTSYKLTGGWSVELESRHSTFAGGFHREGLVTSWTFRAPEGQSFEFQGKVVISSTHEPGEPDDVEEFARAVAGQLGWLSEAEGDVD